MRCQILLRLFSVRFPTRRYRGPGTYHCENPMRMRLVTGVDESCRKRMTDIGGVSAGYKLALAGCGGTKSPAHFHITALGHFTILRPSSNALQVAIRISFVACNSRKFTVKRPRASGVHHKRRADLRSQYLDTTRNNSWQRIGYNIIVHGSKRAKTPCVCIL